MIRCGNKKEKLKEDAQVVAMGKESVLFTLEMKLPCFPAEIIKSLVVAAPLISDPEKRMGAGRKPGNSAEKSKPPALPF